MKVREYTSDEFFSLIRERLNNALDRNHDDEKKARCEAEIRFIEDCGFTDDFLMLHQIAELARKEGQFIWFHGFLNNFYCLYLLGDTGLAPMDFLDNGYDLPFGVVKSTPPDRYVFEVNCTAAFIQAASKVWQCEISTENGYIKYARIVGTRIRLLDDELTEMYQAMRQSAGDIPANVTEDDFLLYTAYLGHAHRYRAEEFAEDEIDITDYDLIEDGSFMDTFEQMCRITGVLYCSAALDMLRQVVDYQPLIQILPCFVDEVYKTIMQYSRGDEDLSGYFVSKLIQGHRLGSLDLMLLETIGVNKNIIRFMNVNEVFDYKGTYIQRCRLYCKLAWYMENHRDKWDMQVKNGFCAC